MKTPSLRIVFLDAPTVDLGDILLKKLKVQGSYTGLSLQNHDPLPNSACEADILIANKYYLGQEEFQKCPRLRLICVAATGTNNIDLEGAKQRGIGVCNVAGYSTPTVVEHTLMFLLAFGHRLMEHHLSSVNGEWSRSPSFALLKFPYHDLKGKRLGIIGYGHIGRGVGKIAKALGMVVSVARMPGRKYSTKEKRVSLKSLLQTSDFVTLHCPLTSLTENLMDGEKLSWMKSSAYLLNLARGPIVDEAAVAKALQSGKLAGYASDVLRQEPSPSDHPFFQPGVREKILLTPHIAWASQESRQRLMDEIAMNIEAFRKGRKRNRLV